LRFCEFISKLYKHFPCSNQGQFVLEIFSALCGEINPAGANQESSNKTRVFKYSSFLPSGLIGEDATYRKRLYGGNKKYNGLSSPIKAYVQSKKNKDTFIAYCRSTISMDEFPKLCETFGILQTENRAIVFEGLYEQFLEFARSLNDNVAFVVPNVVRGLLSNPSGCQVNERLANSFPLYPGDDVLLVEEIPTECPTVGFYEKFEHTWRVKNSGTVTWNGRRFDCVNQATTKVKALTPSIDIPTVKPGEIISVTAKIDARGFEGTHESLWEMKDDSDRLCFPDKNKVLKSAVTVAYSFCTPTEV